MIFGAMLIAVLSMPAQITIVPGDSTHGAALFAQKGCIQCHSFNGQGGSTAPDLAQRPSQSHSPSELAAALWNHSPTMWAKREATGQTAPLMNSTDTADLFAYFYSLLYFDRPADPSGGKDQFVQKCASCHNTGSVRWGRVKDPMIWVERMWNHSGDISRSLAGKQWPSLTTPQMVALISYIDTLSGAAPEAPEFRLGNPNKGLNVFERKCETCHTFGASGSKVDLLSVRAPRTIMDFVAAMWNHGDIMSRTAGNKFPLLAEGEIRDLTAYLYSQRYFAEPGDAARGAQVYINKGCASCHDERPLGKNAPDLAQATERFSPIMMSSALWRSGPAMLAAMKQKKMEWPQFRGSEMTDLIAYLNQRLITRIGQ